MFVLFTQTMCLAPKHVCLIARFGSVAGTVVSAKDLQQGQLSVSVLAPVSNEAVSSLPSTVQAYTTRNRTLVSVPFAFQMRVPPPTVSPSEGSLGGGTLVTISARGWGDVSSNITSVQVEMCRVPAKVISIAEGTAGPSSSVVTVVVETPACSVVGSVKCSIWPTQRQTEVSSSFAFEYYTAAVTSITPNQVSEASNAVRAPLSESILYELACVAYISFAHCSAVVFP
jgi:hypothetical protein